MGMLKTVAQAWKVAEIRSKMIFTLLMLVVFRIGSNIPVPNINRSVLAELFAGETGLFDLFDLYNFRSEYYTRHHCINHNSVVRHGIPLL